MAGGGYKSAYQESRRNAHAEKTIIEVVPGPGSYPTGGFLTGSDTSALRQLRRINAAGTLDMISVLSGHPTGTSGVISASVVSCGVSGNQIGIMCYELHNQSGEDVSGMSRAIIREVPSAQNLSKYDIKVLCQGY